MHDLVWPIDRKPKMWTKLGSFGANRSNGTRKHQGIDLAAPKSCSVYAMYDGIITYDQGWSGPNTKAVLVYNEEFDTTFVYGAVAPNSYPKIGTKVKKGEKIAEIGVYPNGSTMLHLEVWKGKLKPPRTIWKKEKPENNIDPADYLLKILSTTL